MSPSPNLLHPVPIIIQQIDISSTFHDEDFREPIQQSVRKANTTVNGQVKWGIDDSLAMSRGGVSEESAGYVLFRYADLTAASVTLRQNDRFIKIGNVLTDVYILRLQPQGHYPSAGGATLIKAFFADRAPAKQRLGDTS